MRMTFVFDTISGNGELDIKKRLGFISVSIVGINSLDALTKRREWKIIASLAPISIAVPVYSDYEWTKPTDSFQTRDKKRSSWLEFL